MWSVAVCLLEYYQQLRKILKVASCKYEVCRLKKQANHIKRLGLGAIHVTMTFGIYFVRIVVTANCLVVT